MKLKFEKTGGPYGDCTSSYRVTLDGTYAFREFVNCVLTEKKDEWGDFEIYDPAKGWLDYDRYHYRYGTSEPIPDNLLDMKICSVIEAHGGWTCMDYLIKFEKQLEDKS